MHIIFVLRSRYLLCLNPHSFLYSVLKRKPSNCVFQDEQISLDKPSSGGGGLREPASLAHSAYSLAASAFASQDSQLYINGAGLSYGYRGFPGLGATMQHPVSLTTGAAGQSNGEDGSRFQKKSIFMRRWERGDGQDVIDRSIKTGKGSDEEKEIRK